MLSREQVVAIRQRLAAGESRQAVADAEGVSLGAVQRIARGECYWVAGDPVYPLVAGRRPALDADQIEAVRRRRTEGESVKDIAHSLGISPRTLRDHLRRSG